MDYRKYLARTTEEILPYVDGRHVVTPTRRLRVDGPLPPGFHRFAIEGRSARSLGRAEPEGLSSMSAVRGHLVSGWLFRSGDDAERVHLLPEDEPEELSPCLSRRWPSGDLLFDALDFATAAEQSGRLSLEEGGSIDRVKGAAPSLRAAFGYALLVRASRSLAIPVSPLEARAHLVAVASGGSAAARVWLADLGRARAQRSGAPRPSPQPVVDESELCPPPAPPCLSPDRPRPASYPAPRAARGREREAASRQNAERRAEATLASAGASVSSARLLGANLEVTYRFRGERFISVVDALTLQVIDAGICLDGADRLVTLDSLPSVLREAIDTHRLVITRR